MTTPTRLAPASREIRRPPALPRAPEPPRPARIPRAASTSFDRVLGWSIGLSIIVHILVLSLWPAFERETGFRGVAARVAGGVSDPAQIGMEWIIPVPSDAADADAEAEAVNDPPAADSPPVQRRTPPFDRRATGARANQAPPSAGGAGAAGVDEPAAARRSVRESLQPGYRDGRLYVDPRAIRSEREPDRHAAYMEHLQARLDALNDSTYGGRPNTDWTRTDSDGNRWGISPDGLHLGGLTIPRELLPLPQSTGRNAELEAERERTRQREEIIRQENDRAREEARERSRRAAEERRKRRGGGG